MGMGRMRHKVGVGGRRWKIVKVRESLGGVKERRKGPVRERAGRGVGQGDAGAEGEWRFA